MKCPQNRILDGRRYLLTETLREQRGEPPQRAASAIQTLVRLSAKRTLRDAAGYARKGYTRT